MRKLTRTNLPRSSLTSSGSVPLNSRMARRITGQPPPARPSAGRRPSRVPSTRFVNAAGYRPDALHRHVIGKGTGAGHVDSVIEDFEQHRRSGNRVLTMDDGVDQGLAERPLQLLPMVLAKDSAIRFLSPEARKPTQGTTNCSSSRPLDSPTLITSPRCRCPRRRRMDEEARCLRVVLWISSERHHTEEGRVQLPVRLDENSSVLMSSSLDGCGSSSASRPCARKKSRKPSGSISCRPAARITCSSVSTNRSC